MKSTRASPSTTRTTPTALAIDHFPAIGLVGKLSGIRATRWENNLVRTAGAAASAPEGFAFENIEDRIDQLSTEFLIAEQRFQPFFIEPNTLAAEAHIDIDVPVPEPLQAHAAVRTVHGVRRFT